MKALGQPRSRASRVVRAACTLALILGTWGSVAQAERRLDYLYVEANEGDSSGGHAAIRFGKETFHFQHEDPGIVRLKRFDSAAFEYLYAALGNRTIHEKSIAVSDDTYLLLKDSFIRSMMIQDAQMERRDNLRRNAGLLEALSGAGRSPLSLPAVGYFMPEVAVTPGGVVPRRTGATSLVSLRERVRARYGARFIEKRLEELREKIAGTDVTTGEPELPVLSPDRFPAAPPGSATEEVYLASFGVVALTILMDAVPLEEGSYWGGDDEALRLSAEERALLAGYASRLEEDLVRLAGARRRDWALPFVAGAARLSVIRESIAAGRLFFLDLFAPGAAVRAGGGERSYLPALQREAAEVLRERKREFFAGGGAREGHYASLERAANLYLEAERAAKTSSALREPPRQAYPARQARFTLALPSPPDEGSLRRALDEAHRREEEYAKRLLSLYAYHLVRRNCVTEIFRMVNAEMERLCRTTRQAPCSEAQVREESVARLGGYIDGNSGTVFLPFRSAARVDGSYRVVATGEKPSFRSEQLALMQEREPPFLVFWRESNTLTSTIYRPGGDDSAFLFFTDNAGLLRPVFGALNVLAGVGESLYGVVTLPVQGKRHLVSGVRGVLFSVPELFFVSIRKGSMSYVERGGVHPRR